MQFVVISLVILPILPNATYGPYDILNPRQVWWMVVLIVGINLDCRVFAEGRRGGTTLASQPPSSGSPRGSCSCVC